MLVSSRRNFAFWKNSAPRPPKMQVKRSAGVNKGPQASPQATPTYVFSRVWAPWSVHVKPVFHILELPQHENTWKCARSAPDTSCFHAGVLILNVFLHVLKLQQQHIRPEALGIHPEAPQRAPQKAIRTSSYFWPCIPNASKTDAPLDASA